MEEKLLWKKLQEENDSNIKSILVEKYYYLVKYVVGRMLSRLVPVIEYDDLIGEGSIGLLEAMARYDYTRDVKFETYAVARIKGHILDYLRKKDVFSRNARKKLKDLEKVQAKFFEEKGYYGNNEEIRDCLGLTEDDFRKLMYDVSPITLISLDSETELEQKSLKEILSDEKIAQPLEKILKKEVKEKLLSAFNLLPQKEKNVLALYYYEDLTLKEISKTLNISESRVSQIHSCAIIKLRSIISKLLAFKES